MATELTTSWKKVGSKSISGFTVDLYAKYDPDYRSLTSSRVLLFARVTIDNYDYFTGTWCNGGGHRLGIYRNGGWSHENEGSRKIDGLKTWDMPASYEWFTVSCNNGYWSGTIDTWWEYGYYGMNEGNTRFYADVYLPSMATPPSGLGVSNITRAKDGFSATVSVTGWGTGGSTSDRYRELQVWTNSSSGLVEPRRFQPQRGSELSGIITVNNSSSGGSLVINPNTMYVIGAYASNGAANTGSVRIGPYTTLADELNTKSAEVIDTHSIKINYTTKADGGKYAKKIQYSLDNSTWVDGATVSAGSATSGSFNITGLKAGTQYTVYLRISTDAGITTSGSVTAKTKTACKIIRGNSVIEAIPYVIKPDGTKIELNIRRV